MKPILFYGNGEHVSIDPLNILCVKADERYTEVFVKNTAPDEKPFTKYDACINLGTFEKKLPASLFGRASRQMVVNTGWIKSISDSSIKLQIDIKETIAIGKTYRDRFMRKFNHIR